MSDEGTPGETKGRVWSGWSLLALSLLPIPLLSSSRPIRRRRALRAEDRTRGEERNGCGEREVHEEPTVYRSISAHYIRLTAPSIHYGLILKVESKDNDCNKDIN